MLGKEYGVRILNLKRFGVFGWQWVEVSVFGVRTLRTSEAGDGLFTNDGATVASDTQLKGTCDFSMPRSQTAAFRAAQKVAFKQYS